MEMQNQRKDPVLNKLTQHPFCSPWYLVFNPWHPTTQSSKISYSQFELQLIQQSKTITEWSPALPPHSCGFFFFFHVGHMAKQYTWGFQEQHGMTNLYAEETHSAFKYWPGF